MCLVQLVITLYITYSHGIPVSHQVPTSYPVPVLPGQTLSQLELSANIAKVFSGFLMNNRPLDHDAHTSPITSSCPVPIPVINRSLSCRHHQLARIRLSNDDLKHVLSADGVNYARLYMATSAQEAQKNFRNLIPLQADYEDDFFQRHPDNWTWNYSRTKKDILDQLEKIYSQFFVSSTSHTPVKPGRRLLQTLFNNTVNKISKTLQNVHVPLHTDIRSSSMRSLDLQIRDGRLDTKWNIPLHVVSQLLPARYIYPERKKQRRNVNGGVTDVEYCHRTGHKTQDGYLRLCSMCSHTTTLDANHFPRIINEVWCNTNAKGCLYVDGNAHGACRQSVFYVTMLRRKADACMTVIKDGVHYITDEWERYDQPIKVGCECLINKRSMFANYATP